MLHQSFARAQACETALADLGQGRQRRASVSVCRRNAEDNCRRRVASVGKRYSRGMHFGGHDRIVLGHLVDPGDGIIDMADARGLGLGAFGNDGHFQRDRIQIIDHRREEGVDPLDEPHAFFDGLVVIQKQIADFRSGLRGPFGKSAHLLGDDGKPPPGLSGAGSFDAGVQCQEIGLKGDGIDDRWSR